LLATSPAYDGSQVVHLAIDYESHRVLSRLFLEAPHEGTDSLDRFLVEVLLRDE
jgi:hypothetical protein